MTPLQRAIGSAPIMSRRALERTRLGQAIGGDAAAWDDLEELLVTVDGGKTRHTPNTIHDAVSPRSYSALDYDDWVGVIGRRAVDAILDLGEKAGLKELCTAFARPTWIGKSAEDTAAGALDDLCEALDKGRGAMLEWDEMLSAVRRSVAARQTLSTIFEDDMELDYDSDDMEKNLAAHRAALAARPCNATPPAGWGDLVQLEGGAFREYAEEHAAMARVLRALLKQDEAAAALVSDADIDTAKRGAARGQP